VPRPPPKPSPARKWLSVATATVLLLLSYSLILLPIMAGPEGGEAFGASLGVGLALVPLVFVVAAFMSQNDRAALSIAKASGLWVLIAVPIAYFGLISDLLALFIAGLVTGFGAGGIVAFRPEQGQSRARRVRAVALTAIYTYIIVSVSPVAGLFGGAVLSFVAIAFADEFGNRRREQQED